MPTYCACNQPGAVKPPLTTRSELLASHKHLYICSTHAETYLRCIGQAPPAWGLSHYNLPVPQYQAEPGEPVIPSPQPVAAHLASLQLPAALPFANFFCYYKVQNQPRCWLHGSYELLTTAGNKHSLCIQPKVSSMMMQGWQLQQHHICTFECCQPKQMQPTASVLLTGTMQSCTSCTCAEAFHNDPTYDVHALIK